MCLSPTACLTCIAVTRGSYDAAVAHWRGQSSGSLMINTGLTDKKQHLETPFTVDWPAGKDRFVHVFDELTVDMLLSGVDTVSDLVGYFSEKERFLSSAEYVPWPTARQPWHKDACNRHNQRGMEWVM